MTGTIPLPLHARSHFEKTQDAPHAFYLGKYRGRCVNEVDEHYPRWIQKTFSDPWCKTATERRSIKRQQRAKSNVTDLIFDLKFCSKRKDLQEGRRVHTIAVETGIDSNVFVAAALINMYGKCGSMVDAQTMFNKIQKPDVASWTVLILGYADNGQGYYALGLFSKMKTCVCAPNCMTYVAALKACTSLAANGDEAGKGECLKRGREIHSEIGHHMDHILQNTLIHMYSNCGSMVDAERVFSSIKEPNVVSWTALILGYADNEQGGIALEIFSRMKVACGCVPDSFSYVAAIKACASLAATGDEMGKTECLNRGREIHLEIGKRMNHIVQSTLVNMYAKGGSMVDAQRVFDSIEEPNVVSWTALIGGYADNGESQAALEMFWRMKSVCNCAPNSVTCVAALKACTSLAAEEDVAGKVECLKRGREIHLTIGHHMDHCVQSTLIKMYAKCGSMLLARLVFDSIKEPDVVSWTTLITGYVENGDSQAALHIFCRMKTVHGCAPDSMAYIAGLQACGSIGSLAIGRKFHVEMRDFNVHVVTCLVDFYAKCGSMVEAREVFNSHTRARDITTWNALMTGYGSFGDIVSVFNLFDAMQEQEIRADAVTFVCILSCCSHAGLVKKAREYLEAMLVQYGVAPTVMHYNCMIDILGRANELDEAVSLLRKMPCHPNTVTWTALLGVCRKWKNVELGRLAFQSLVDLDEKNVAAYVLMAQIYGSRGMWEEQEQVLETKRKLAWKLRGQAYVMDGLEGMVKFGDGEEDASEVKDKLQQYLQGIKVQGCVAELYTVGDGEKGEALCGHSERRAVLYGLLNTPLGEPVRVFKNMKMCDDCHWAIKFFSKYARRAIIVRDERHFHVIENGNCSCEAQYRTS